ncbi:PREDICTED: acyl-protein thioesterase 1 [Ceratosolen solmsi marchali]|uniref:palmitoyl-protein hydrolase n=1 Tax=Ceratosolen solmsi marchali TaxID=326594 RepID=A0AAJ7DWG7_9HYME|nr:PREDICTED: acyl-protein thioesterase 1 [Ceratosolen solmsi marchali]
MQFATAYKIMIALDIELNRKFRTHDTRMHVMNPRFSPLLFLVSGFVNRTDFHLESWRLFTDVREKKLKTMSSPVVIAATTRHTATLIFLHGLGDTGHGWASSLGSLRPAHVKVICPTAPTMPVTLNQGFRMPSWFDLRSLDDSGPEDEESIRKAADIVHSLIASEVAGGISTERIVLAGFSQGGALALFSALTFPQPLAGIIALSTWLPLRAKFPQEAVGNRNTPVLQCHGNCDPLVPYKWGQATSTLLKQFMTQIEFKTYEGVSHASCDEELQDIKEFIEKLKILSNMIPELS